MFSMIQVNRIYLIFNPVHFLVDSSEILYFKNLIVIFALLSLATTYLRSNKITIFDIKMKEKIEWINTIKALCMIGVYILHTQAYMGAGNGGGITH